MTPTLRRSIKAKLSKLVMLTSGLALLVSVTLIGINEVVIFRRSMVRDIATLATIIADNSSSALEFDRPETASETLATLEHQSHIVAAAIYAENKVFAGYVRGGHDWKAAEWPKLGKDGHVFGNGELVLFQPIEHGGERIGTIYLRMDTGELRGMLVRYAAIAGLVLLCVLKLAYVVSSKQLQAISQPILDLASTAHEVSEQKNYSLRATVKADDEVGFLIDRFNEMLAQIEQHEKNLKAVNGQLLESQELATAATQAKSQFLANMSHELRTPLNAIIGYSEMLQEEAEDSGAGTFVPDLKKIHTAGKHLLNLINDILDLSKIEAGKMELYLESFDLRVMLDDVVATAEILMKKKNNRLNFIDAGDLGTVRADITKVRQSLFNLISNAGKFTENGTVTLDARRESETGTDWIVFRVTDSGIGMTPDQMGNLFRAFSQADPSTSRKFGGTGLGLAITRHFSQMMGGDVTVSSEVGKGSTFTLRIPAHVRDPATEAEGSTPPEPDSLPQDGNTVLVVDDDPSARELLQRYLNKEGFHVQCAAGGEECLELARRIHPSAITLDVMMPGMDGWAVLTALKADAATADIPVIMLSIVDNKNMGFALGAADYITKPVDRDRLAATLQRFRDIPDPRTVLIVEDDEPTRFLMARMLEKEGWTVAQAGDGIAGLEQLGQARPSLILLDLMMPRMDGFQFVVELRKRAEWRTIPVIVVTAKTLTQEDRVRLSGCVEKVVEKEAFSGDELLLELSGLVERNIRRTAGKGVSGLGKRDDIKAQS